MWVRMGTVPAASPLEMKSGLVMVMMTDLEEEMVVMMMVMVEKPREVV